MMNNNPPQESPPDRSFIPGGDDKYAKLTQEYQRIKSQNAILKKAVIQEQQKSQNLEKELREAEQKLRQVTEELDILQFNNQRLTKRLSVLQEELGSKSKDGQGGLFGWGSSRDLNKKVEELDVLRNELDQKIKENAELHVQYTDLQEELNQVKQLNTDQVAVIKACVVAKQEEVDDVTAELKKLNGVLTQTREDLDKQQIFFKESEEKLGREIQQIVAEINQSRKKYKQKILNPSAAPPSPLAIWRDNKHSRDLIGTFKELYDAVESHWDTHMDKITLLRSMNPPEQLDLIYKELASTIPSLSTQMTHIAESLQQYLPVLFSKDALPNIEFADTLHRFVNTCKRWLSYQQLRHLEHSQQPGPLAAAHAAFADTHSQALKALDKLVQDRELSAIRALCGILGSLKENARTVYGQEVVGDNEEIAEINERLVLTQEKVVDLLEQFAAKLEDYESAGTGAVQEGEESHRLREVASHLIILNNDINVATKERELQILSLHRDMDVLRIQVKELQDIISKKETQVSVISEEWSNAKEQGRLLTQQIDTLRKQLTDQENAFTNQSQQQQQLHKHQMEEQKLQYETSQARLIANLDASHQNQIVALQNQISALRQEIDKEKQTVISLQQALEEKARQIGDLEATAAAEKHRLSEQIQLLGMQEGKEKEVLAKHAQELQALQTQLEQVQNNWKSEVDEKTLKITELRNQVSGVEGSARAEQAEKVQQIKTLQQKLVAQEQKLEERTRQIQAFERMVAEKEQTITKLLQKTAEQNGVSSHASGDEITKSPTESETSQPVVAASTPEPQRVQPLIEETPPPTPPTPAANAARYSVTVVDQDGNQSNGLHMSPPDKEREQAMQSHYETKIQQLTAQTKASDAKAVQLFEQYSTLLKVIEEKEGERNALLEQIKTSNLEIQTKSTRNNYDAQLRLMSDHLLELGEKFMKVEAEFGHTKACKVACGKCKTWNTIDWLITEGKGGQKCVKGNHPLATFST